MKAKLVDVKAVDATAIQVETLHGTVQLSGFAKTASERSRAETLARSASGVKEVRNSILVRS